MDESTSMSSAGRTLAARTTRRSVRSSSPAVRTLFGKRPDSPTPGVGKLLALKSRPSLDRQGEELQQVKSQLAILITRVEKLTGDLVVETERADVAEKAWEHERDKANFFEEGYNNLKSQSESDQANAVARIQSLEATAVGLTEQLARMQQAGRDIAERASHELNAYNSDRENMMRVINESQAQVAALAQANQEAADAINQARSQNAAYLQQQGKTAEEKIAALMEYIGQLHSHNDGLVASNKQLQEHNEAFQQQYLVLDISASTAGAEVQQLRSQYEAVSYTHLTLPTSDLV